MFCVVVQGDQLLLQQIKIHYVIAHFEGAVHLFVHAVVIERHEERVDNNAQRDEELDERVVDEKADELLELDPVRRTVPHAANVQILERKGQQPLLDLRTFIFFVGICRIV